MKHTIRLILIVVIRIYSVSCSRTKQAHIDSKEAYFGLTPPGITPEVLAPGSVSDSTWAEHSQVAVSPGGQYFFYMRHIETQDFFRYLLKY